MQATSIEWTDYSASLLKYRDAAGKTVHACVKISPGCRGCYAEAIAQRFGRGGPYTKAATDKVTPFFDEEEATKILRSKKLAGKRVFVDDMTDLFGEWVPDEIIDRHFAVFALRPDVTFQLLTKRAERMREYCKRFSDNRTHLNELACWCSSMANWACGAGLRKFQQCEDEDNPDIGEAPTDHVYEELLEAFGGFSGQACLDNVHLGVSVENQPTADERIPHLLQTLAAVRFLSCEPLLSQIILHKYFAQCACGHGHGFTACPNTGGVAQQCDKSGCQQLRPKLSWVICGGESGAHARPCNVAWIRSIVQQCRAASAPVFVKQLGSKPYDNGSQDAGCWWPDQKAYYIDSQDGREVYFRKVSDKGGNPEEWPEDLRVREFPTSLVKAS